MFSAGLLTIQLNHSFEKSSAIRETGTSPRFWRGMLRSMDKRFSSLVSSIHVAQDGMSVLLKSRLYALEFAGD
jgi:hypothetical protein